MTMQLEATTSAFGRRAVTRAQIEAQIAVRQARERAAGQGAAGAGAVHKWTLLRTLSEIRDGLGVSDRALGVLSALASFHPETALTLEGGDLVVFPSNKALALRCNGMSEPTLRRHLAALVEVGLIIRRDSPNGKRFARREEDGEGIAQAFGFDLSPLAARAGEFDARLERLRAERRRERLLKERITLLRRDLTKRIAFALDEALAGPWEDVRQSFLGLCTPLRKLRALADFARLADDLGALQARVSDTLEKALQNPTGDGAHFKRQIPESNPDQFSDFEPASNEAGVDGAPPTPRPEPSGAASASKELPLALVLEACPDIRDYDFSGDRIDSWRAFVDVAASVRPMLGVSPDAWREAVETLGERSAATAIAFILQRCEHSSQAVRHSGPDGRLVVTVNGSPAIRSPGGYLRALTQEARKTSLNLWGAILGHLSQRGKAARAYHNSGSTAFGNNPK
jgi:replication initiation protein RepC